MNKTIKEIIFGDNLLNDIFVELFEARYKKMSFEIDYNKKKVIFIYE